jgi:hypothetical protein
MRRIRHCMMNDIIVNGLYFWVVGVFIFELSSSFMMEMDDTDTD